MHNVEVERRRGSEKVFKATSGLILLALGASFIYTTLSKQSTDIAIQEMRISSDSSFVELRESQAKASENIANLSQVVARNEGALNPLLIELSNLNYSLNKIVRDRSSGK